MPEQGPRGKGHSCEAISKCLAMERGSSPHLRKSSLLLRSLKSTGYDRSRKWGLPPGSSLAS